MAGSFVYNTKIALASTPVKNIFTGHVNER